MYSIYLALISLVILIFSFLITEYILDKVIKDKPADKSNTAFLSRYHTNLLKGIGAFFVVYSHIGYPNYNRLWGFTGGVAVTLFLFCSGYGVNESYKKNGLKNYFVKRIIYTSIPYWLMTIFMWFFYHTDLTVWGYVKQLLFIDPHYFWFIQFLIVQYIIFFVVKYFIRHPNTQLLIFLIINVAIFFINPSMSWGSQVLSFFLGFYISENRIAFTFPKNKKLLYYAAAAIVIGISALAIKQIDIVRNSHYLILNFNQMILYLCLAFAIISITYVTLHWPIWQYLQFSGKYSFNIYIVSWLILVETIADIQPGIFDLIVYSFFTIIAIFIFSLINNYLMHLINQIQVK